MDAESVREYLLQLPEVVETMQWGANLVFWVGDKAIGGRMFALVNLEPGDHGVISFAAGAERYAELVEIDGVVPAPYFARAYWVALERWDALRAPELRELLRHARDIVEAKLSRRTREVLALSPAERKKQIATQKKLAAAAKTSVRKRSPKRKAKS
jgi:predicted DNA-binding protein (MmcQ/YjbR family)